MKHESRFSGCRRSCREAVFLVALSLVATVCLPGGGLLARPQNGVVYQDAATGHLYCWIGTRMTWENANSYAGAFSAEYGGRTYSQWHLATVTSESENTFVFQTVLDGGDYEDFGLESESFLGAIVRDGSAGNFEWLTGEAFSYSNFAVDQPSLERENVLEMGGEFGALWNDEDGPGSSVVVEQSFIIETVPEPATIGLLAVGLLAMNRARRLKEGR